MDKFIVWLATTQQTLYLIQNTIVSRPNKTLLIQPQLSQLNIYASKTKDYRYYNKTDPRDNPKINP